MPKSGGIKGSAVLIGTAGLYLVYVGVKDVPFFDGLRSILNQKRPQSRETHFPYVAKIAQALADLPPATTGVTAVGSRSIGEMVSVRGTLIHHSIAGNLDRMITRAQTQGVNLDPGDGFRTSAQQAQRRKDNNCTCDDRSDCCSPPTAPVGQSQHELGLAVDFQNCRTRATACYKWLAAHAAEFGFYNLPSEPWHWSTTGK